MPRWRCRHCGIEYASRPSVCPDCNATDFAVVEGDGDPSGSRAGDDRTDDDGPDEDLPAPDRAHPFPSWSFYLVFALVLAVLLVGIPLVHGGSTDPTCAGGPLGDGETAPDSDRARVECAVYERVLELRPADLLPREVEFDDGKRGTARRLAATMAAHGYDPATARIRLNPTERFGACRQGSGNSGVLLSAVPRGNATGPDRLAEAVARRTLSADLLQRWIERPGRLDYAVGVHVGPERVYAVQALC